MRFRVSDEEREEIIAAATKAGQTYGTFIVRTVLAASRTGSPGAYAVLTELSDGLRRAAVQLNRIGVNLNQMTRAANATGELSDSLPYALDYLTDVLRHLDAVTVEVRRRLQ